MRCIFLADDDADDREALKEALLRAGSPYPVVEAEDSCDVLRMLNDLNEKGFLPCLIVLDLRMPKIDGRELLLSLHADAVLSTVPVVIYSTFACFPKFSGVDWGKVPFLSKPFDSEGYARVAASLLSYCACDASGEQDPFILNNKVRK